MPRTSSRKDASSGPPAAVDALDALDLDGMFEGGDEDGLFAGIDIDMDMGDLTNNNDQPSGGSRRKSPQKRKSTQQSASGPGASNSNLDAVTLDLFDDIGVDDGVTTGSTTKTTKSGRRSVKRKPEDDDDEYEPDKKKSKRKSKPTAKSRASKKKKDSSDAGGASNSSTTSSSKLSRAKSLPTAASRMGSSQEGSAVAAAGMVGARANKRSKSQKSGTSGSNTSKSSGSSIPVVVPPAMPFAKRQKSSTVGSLDMSYAKLMDTSTSGIKPSRKLFYPFLPSVPPEATLKKYAKGYVALDKIHQAYDNFKKVNAAANKRTMPDAKEKDAIYRLLYAELEQQNATPSSSNLFLQKKQAMGGSIASSRQMVGNSDQMSLVQDLQGICALLTRQFDFVTQSMENMQHWCRDNFSASDYNQVYDPVVTSGGAIPSNLKKRKSISKPNVMFGFKSNTLRVKVVFKKMSKSLTPLTAVLPCVGGSGKPIEGAPKPKKVRTKPPTTGTSGISSKTTGGASTDPTGGNNNTVRTSRPSQTTMKEPPEAVLPPTYAELRPAERRHEITDAIRLHAISLEKSGDDPTADRKKLLEKRVLALTKVVEEDPVTMINTTTLWKWVVMSGFYSDITEDDIADMLSIARGPEPVVEPPLWEENQSFAIEAIKSRSSNTVTTDENADLKKAAAKHSTYLDRLTDLLVEEGSGDEEDESDEADSSDDDSILDGWERDKPWVNSMPDLSRLTFEERAHFHLKSIGLVDESCPPPAVVEEEEESLADLPASVRSANEQNDLDEFDAVIQSMKNDLDRLQRLNNSRAAFLEQSARALMILSKEQKRKDEQDTALVNKHNALLKKQKESRKGKQKSGKKGQEETWVPW